MALPILPHHEPLSGRQSGRSPRLVHRHRGNDEPLPADEQNPLAEGAIHDDVKRWLASKEAKALLARAELEEK